MQETAFRAIAIVGVGAILPDAPDAPAFWSNLIEGRYSITDVLPDRWDPAAYYDPAPDAPDKTYSKIGGWVRAWSWDPLAWKLPIPPRVSDAMDDAQKWAIACSRQALTDYGWPRRPLNLERTAAILGNAMAGERHYLTALRIAFPEYAGALRDTPSFAALAPEVRAAIGAELHARIATGLPEITEDTMPGELGNIIAGRVANLFNLRGPNYVTDAACASAMAAISAAVEGLVEGDFDAVLTGGIDRNMGAATFVKFCKIGALSATGTRPYADGADGFVMGEGAAVFLLKRLADAERDGDRVYAVLRGIAGASDGKGKGITAPNPVGQRLAVARAWQNAGLPPNTVGLIEGHGTSTRVGDVVEVEGLTAVFGEAGLAPSSVPLGSVKSNIGHLKGAAGAAGILKAVLALHHKRIPPSLHCERPNPAIDFAHSPFRVNTELCDWRAPSCGVRRAGVSAFGFGGTNFHAVLEEHQPGRLTARGTSVAVPANPTPGSDAPARVPADAETRPDALVAEPRPPLRGALLLGAATVGELRAHLEQVQAAASAGSAPPAAPPALAALRAAQRLAIDYGDARELADKTGKALRALAADTPAMWKALRAQGIFRGHGAAAKVAFLYTGQGSQYVNMLAELRRREPIVAATFAEADQVMTPLLGRPLSDLIFVDPGDAGVVAAAEEALRQTAVTQPAVLTADLALTRLLAAYGIAPDMVMGHSLGEYGALVAAGALTLGDALEAVSARGREMSQVAVDDCGRMAAVLAPLADVERMLAGIDGHVVIANVNSHGQSVVGGASDAVDRAVAAFQAAGFTAVPLPVSHAFHTSIVAPASAPLRATLERLHLRPPRLPIVANVDGRFYPMEADAVPRMLDILARQVAEPVQFVAGLETLYGAGARVFVEVGPKKALQGFVDDVLGGHDDVVALFTNHPKQGDVVSFNQALCGLWAAGLGRGVDLAPDIARGERRSIDTASVPARLEPPAERRSPGVEAVATPRDDGLGALFAEFLARARQLSGRGGHDGDTDGVVVSGAALGLPGTPRVFDDGNLARILHGEQFIDVIPTRFRQAMLDKHITRLVKRDDGGGSFEPIDSPDDVIKLAARAGAFDLAGEFGVAAERVEAYDVDTRLAVGAGLDALRDAGIPLVQHYRTTHKGTALPAGWRLPEALRDDTGIIFASAFPGYDAFAAEMAAYHADHAQRRELATLVHLRDRLRAEADGSALALTEIERRIGEIEGELAAHPYAFDRRFLFRVLSMGHSQFAELVGARGPNTHINSACASTTQAFALAEDWIAAGRCRRVVIVAADDVTSDHMLGWFGAGFLASGAAATDDDVAQAALPFDRRRHGMLLGMGAAAFVVESRGAAAERGVHPICEVLGAVTANSAFHGTRLDVEHICQVMEELVAGAEARWGIERRRIAPQLVFISHETYTPARGGSAAAEVHALRQVFGADADRIVIANTKGFTGHPMGVGIEDVVAVKTLETGLVPPVANFREVDPDLGALNLSQGGAYPVQYALRLGAGFGSQISMTLLRWVPTRDGRRRAPHDLGYAYRIADPVTWRAWLARVSGQGSAEVEVVHRTLRIRTAGAEIAAIPSADTAGPTAAPDLVEPAAPAAAATVTVDDVRERVLALVAEKTGYPIDMLDPELDLEADLGIDTVKQAELFASIRGAYGIARDESLKLRDFPTLNHVVQFVRDRRPDLAVAEHIVGPAEPAAAATATADDVRERVLALVAEKTGYPIDMLDPELDLEADLGIDTVKQAELFASIREAYGIPRDETLKLRDFPTLNHVVQFVRDRRPDLAVAEHIVGPAEPAAAATATATADDVRERVLALVAEKTGYPIDMLDPELDLEADLGIDTVKQAELFASIREAYGIPRDETLKLRDFPTLEHVFQFVRDRRADLSAPPPAGGAGAPHEAGAGAKAGAPRRVPVAVLRPPFELCKATAVTLGGGTRVVVMLDRGGVGEALVRRLKGRGVEVLAIDGAPSAEALLERLSAWSTAAPVHGVYWLPALDVEGDLRALDLPTWREALRVRVKLLYAAMRALYDQIAAPQTFLVAASRLGGQHGYDSAGAVAPLGGAVTGFVKSYKRERPRALVKAVDFEAGRAGSEAADLLIEETLRDPGAVEVGHRAKARWTVALREQPAADGQPGLVLGRDSVFVVTGAAGGITAAITADLAAASGGTFHLLDVAPPPDAGNPDLQRFARDRDGLKRELFERLRARGERATPAMVERELAGLERQHAALSAMQAVERAGGTARYHQLDLRDGAAVAAAIDDVRARSGRIDVLLHAGGLEVSRLLPDKEPAEFERVFDVKSDGWFNLLHAVGDMPLGAAVAFSSIAARFGNGGQTDYAAANDLLCKCAASFRTTRPATRAIAIDWTAWAGIGMASRGSIPKMMEIAGIDMLPPEIGVPVIRHELTAGGWRGEVLIGERLGILLDELDEHGGLDVAAALAAPHGPMIGSVRGMSVHDGLTVDTRLDPTAQPFLHDHQIDGTAVLPGVMGLEGFAELATLAAPGWHLVGIEDVEFLAPVKFYRNEPRTLSLVARLRADGDEVVAECRLSAARQLVGHAVPEVTTHFTASVRLARAIATPAHAAVPSGAPGAVGAPQVYDVYFHGPAYRVLRQVWRSGKQVVGELAAPLPADHVPSESPTCIAPRLIELCFQTAGIWELGTSGRMALPQHIGAVQTLAPPVADGRPLYAVVSPGNGNGFDAEVVDADGTVVLRLRGYRTVALPSPVDAARLAPLRDAMKG